MKFLLRYQLDSGGFYSLDGEKRFLEPVCTAWGGMAALTTGRQGEVFRAGDLLVRLAAEPPDARNFYSRMDLDGKIVMDVPEGAALRYFVDADHRNQIYYNPGISLIFLSHLHLATGRPSYRDACNVLFDSFSDARKTCTASRPVAKWVWAVPCFRDSPEMRPRGKQRCA